MRLIELIKSEVTKHEKLIGRMGKYRGEKG